MCVCVREREMERGRERRRRLCTGGALTSWRGRSFSHPLSLSLYIYIYIGLGLLTEMCSGSEAGSYSRLIDSCITQFKAHGPSKTCNESNEEEEKSLGLRVWGLGQGSGFGVQGLGSGVKRVLLRL